MKSFTTTAVLLAAAAASLHSFASANSRLDFLKTRQTAPQSCHEDSVLCPGCSGRNITDGAGERWAISCDFIIEAEQETAVGGEVSTSICLDACNDNDNCFGVTFAPNGSCIIASGLQQGLGSASGYTNLARLAPTTTSSVSRVSVAGTSSASASASAAASATYSGTSSQCNVDDEELCPKCSGGVTVDSNGKSWRVLCDTSLDSMGSYSPQEWLTTEECLEECDKHDFCTGVTYFGERSCELAKANPDTTFDDSFTAFLPLSTPTASSTARLATSSTGAWNPSLAAAAAGPTVSIRPINSSCNVSAVTCDACDGYRITDSLNGSYTAICAREPACFKTGHRGKATQEECLQKCDQDVACLAAMWSPDPLFCNLCLHGMELNRVAGMLPYVLLAADWDGDGNFMTSSRIGSVNTVSVATLLNATSIRNSTIAYVKATSSSRSSLAPTSSATTSQAPVVCPASDNAVYVDAGSRNAFAVGCDSRFDAAHSSYVIASNFEACAALCTAPCDGVQFGATTRCGLYTDITLIGGAPSWTAAARITVSGTTGVPASITSIVVSANVSAAAGLGTTPTKSGFVYASPLTSAVVTSRRLNATAALLSPGVTRASPGPYSFA